MNKQKEMQLIKKRVKEAFEKNGVKLPRMTYRWSNRFTRIMGQHMYKIDTNNHTQSHTLTFSAKLWPRATEKQRKQTAIHEACHVIATIRFGYKVKSHGREWKSCMIKAGLEPKRCHNVDTTELKRKVKKYLSKCNCREVWVTKPIINRAKRGVLYLCTKCNSHPKFFEEITKFA